LGGFVRANGQRVGADNALALAISNAINIKMCENFDLQATYKLVKLRFDLESFDPK
jgi:hypothetical protein